MSMSFTETELLEKYTSLTRGLEAQLISPSSLEDVNFMHRSLAGLSIHAYRFPNFFERDRVEKMTTLLTDVAEKYFVDHPLYGDFVLGRAKCFVQSVFLNLKAREALPILDDFYSPVE